MHAACHTCSLLPPSRSRRWPPGLGFGHWTYRARYVRHRGTFVPARFRLSPRGVGGRSSLRFCCPPPYKSSSEGVRDESVAKLAAGPSCPTWTLLHAGALTCRVAASRNWWVRKPGQGTTLEASNVGPCMRIRLARLHWVPCPRSAFAPRSAYGVARCVVNTV